MLTANSAYVRQKYENKQANAISRNIEFTLTIEEYCELLMNQQYCYYTGVRLVQNRSTFDHKGKGKSIKPKPNSISIDRVFADQGYNSNNVVACSYKANYAKNIMEQYNNIEVSLIQEIQEGIEAFKKGEMRCWPRMTAEQTESSKRAEKSWFKANEIPEPEEKWYKEYKIELLFGTMCILAFIAMMLTDAKKDLINIQVRLDAYRNLLIILLFYFVVFIMLTVIRKVDLFNVIKTLKNGKAQ